MTIRIHNTLNRAKEEFIPEDPQNVRMYVCGPTVYDHAHIGNARPPVVFDVFYRLLRHVYGAEHVTYARNITDIDDKIMKRAAEEGVGIEVISKRYTDIYNADLAGLNVLPPDIEPKATEHLDEMRAMIQKLIDKGHAYEAEGHVMFDVASMETYGRLSKHGRDELVAGARVEVAPYKRDAADFVLWKPSADDQPGWDSPWGRGRPGWHLECSSMIEKHLGETIDVHGGGQDLIFPHHENEIAQSECCHGKQFVKYWMHNGYLNMSGEKMSKSLGNIRSISSLLEDYPGEALRLTLLGAHYRQPLDFNTDVIAEQKKRLDRWYRLVDGVEEGELSQDVIAALEDDLNTPQALAVLEGLAKPETAGDFLASARFIGLLMDTADNWFRGDVADGLSPDAIEALIAERVEAKANRDFALSDKIRDDLKDQGIALEDGPAGTTWRREG